MHISTYLPWILLYCTFRAFPLFHFPSKLGDFILFLLYSVLYNENIKVGNEQIKHDQLIVKGKYLIKHFVKENRDFMTYEEFVSDIDVCLNFVTFNGWISSIRQYVDDNTRSGNCQRIQSRSRCYEKRDEFER
jgi:hypothetical protein